MVEIKLMETDLRKIVVEHLNERLESLALKPESVKFFVKSKQNYSSKWEETAVEASNCRESYIPELKVLAKQ